MIKFISIEGSEGAGKTTALKYMQQWLSDRGIAYIVTREPGGTPLAEKLRGLLLETHDESIDPMTELMLMFAARKQHVEHVIKPALESGQWVISDRFTDATYAYQGAARNMSFDLIKQFEQLVLDGFTTDHTLLFDLPVEIGLERAKQRGSLDRFEQEKISFFESVRAGYLQLANEHQNRISVIDAEKSIEDVKQQIGQVMSSWI
jgi:dTMP kinase